MEQIASGYDCREHFLTELALDPPDGTRAPSRNTFKDEDYTILSTMHSAKGQEWRVVRILNAVDGCLPSDQADGIDEGRLQPPAVFLKKFFSERWKEFHCIEKWPLLFNYWINANALKPYSRLHSGAFFCMT